MLCLTKLVAKARQGTFRFFQKIDIFFLPTHVLPEVIFLRSYAQLLQLLIRAYPAYRRADYSQKGYATFTFKFAYVV